MALATKIIPPAVATKLPRVAKRFRGPQPISGP